MLRVCCHFGSGFGQFWHRTARRIEFRGAEITVAILQSPGEPIFWIFAARMSKEGPANVHFQSAIRSLAQEGLQWMGWKRPLSFADLSDSYKKLSSHWFQVCFCPRKRRASTGWFSGSGNPCHALCRMDPSLEEKPVIVFVSSMEGMIGNWQPPHPLSTLGSWSWIQLIFTEHSRSERHQVGWDCMCSHALAATPHPQGL